MKDSRLVLMRRPGEVICIGDDILLTIVRFERGAVQVAINAPRDVAVDRLEIRQMKEAQVRQ